MRFTYFVTEWTSFDWPVVCHVTHATFAIVHATFTFVVHSVFLATLHSLSFHEPDCLYEVLLFHAAVLQSMRLCFTSLSWVWLFELTACDHFICNVDGCVTLLSLLPSCLSVPDVDLHFHLLLFAIDDCMTTAEPVYMLLTFTKAKMTVAI